MSDDSNKAAGLAVGAGLLAALKMCAHSGAEVAPTVGRVLAHEPLPQVGRMVGAAAQEAPLVSSAGRSVQAPLRAVGELEAPLARQAEHVTAHDSHSAGSTVAELALQHGPDLAQGVAGSGDSDDSRPALAGPGPLAKTPPGPRKGASPEETRETPAVDREALAAWVRGHTQAIQACYETALARQPDLQGRVVMLFTITPKGRTTDVSVEENAAGFDAVGVCLQGVVRDWTFPFHPTEEVTVSYPFVFSPAK